jgi:uncharacterized protein
MFIDIHVLAGHPLNFDEKIPPGLINYGPEVRQVADLVTRGNAEVIKQEIYLRGTLITVIEVSCARCLEPARQQVSLSFELCYQPMRKIARSEDIEIRPSDLGIAFYEGQGLQLDDVLKEQVLLTLPMRTLCRPACAGLCPRCGSNRNLKSCQCSPTPTDIRWEALAKLKK